LYTLKGFVYPGLNLAETGENYAEPPRLGIILVHWEVSCVICSVARTVRRSHACS